MSKRNRKRHQLGRLGARVAEHHALITRADLVGIAAVDALSDVGRLTIERHHHAAGIAIEALEGVVVADVAHGAAHEVGDIDTRVCRNLAGDDDDAGRDQRLTGDARQRILREHGVEHRVGDLVGNLVGVSLGDGLRGKQHRMFLRHVALLNSRIVKMRRIITQMLTRDSPERRTLG